MNNNERNEIENQTFSENSVSVQSHLQITQGIIYRMAANSTSCKTWCIAIVSAILVLTANSSMPELVFLALAPAILFLFLDAYYLALEKSFRQSYNEFVRKLHSKKLVAEDLFLITPKGKTLKHELDALKSFSIWGFYSSLAITIWLAEHLLKIMHA